MMNLHYFPVSLSLSLSIHWCMLCIFHLKSKLIKNRQNVFKSLRCFLRFQCSDFRHLNTLLQKYSFSRNLFDSTAILFRYELKEYYFWNKIWQVFYKQLMLSYLTNRHYHLLTRELPQQLRSDQPKVVYLPSHTCEKVQIKSPVKTQSKLKIRKSKQMIDSNPNIGDCCPICFSADNIDVQFYGKQHVCVKCRKLIRDQFGNQIRIFIDEQGQIVCLGIKAEKKKDPQLKKIYYYTDYTNLNINGRSAFATFAKPDEMVLILRMPKYCQQ